MGKKDDVFATCFRTKTHKTEWVMGTALNQSLWPGMCNIGQFGPMPITEPIIVVRNSVL